VRDRKNRIGIYIDVDEGLRDKIRNLAKENERSIGKTAKLILQEYFLKKETK